MKEKRTLPTLLFLGFALILFRAFGWIDCSWWLVTAPLWLPVALLLLFILAIGGMFFIVIMQDIISRWKQKN